MSDELIHLPEAKEIKEFLEAAKHDINTAIQEESELAIDYTLVLEVIQILEDQLSGKKDLNKLNLKEKISFMAHLNFLQYLLEETFLEDELEEFDDEFDDELDELDDEHEFEEEEEDQLEDEDQFRNKKNN